MSDDTTQNPATETTIVGYDHEGRQVDVGGVEQGEVGEVDIIMPAVEAACACALRDCKFLVDALGAMVKASVPGSTQAEHHVALTSDHADSTVKLMRTVARDALVSCMAVPETDMRLLAARAMLKSFHDGLMAVNIERDSAPGIALAKLFIPCCHVVLSARRTPASKRDALDKWKEGRKRILYRMAKAG